MACDTLIFNDVTPELYARLCGKARKAGIELGGPHGRVKAKGCVFDYDYEEATGTLAVTCDSKPLYKPCFLVNATITDLMNQAKQEPPEPTTI